MATNFFNPMRVGRLIHLEIINLIKPAFIWFGILVLLAVMFPYNEGDPLKLFALFLFVGGLSIASRSFVRIKSETYYTLPCSVFERFFSQWLISVIGYPLLLFIAFLISSWFGFFVNKYVINLTASGLELQNPLVLTLYERYIVLQALFMFGGLYFAKYSAAKTLLTICLIVIVMTTVSSIVALWACPDCVVFAKPNWAFMLFEHQYFYIWMALAVLAWILTYFLLRYKQG